jgi:succinate-semialdehyde dehydrogenase/glutarate-semialdehyde dehydrogenase
LAKSARVRVMRDFGADATERGARLALGGGADLQQYFPPTVVTDVLEQARMAFEEAFGPIAPMFRSDTFDEDVARANQLEFGLAPYVYTRSMKTR